jgi:hypothetical protein
LKLKGYLLYPAWTKYSLMDKGKGFLSSSFLLKALLIAAFFVYYTDYLAYTSMGLYVSIAMTIIAIFLAFFDFRSSLIYSLIIIFMSARVPRNMTDIMTRLKVTKEIEFHSIAASTIASFSLAQWIMITLGIVAFLKLFRHGLKIKLDKRIINLIVLYLFVMIVMYLATVIDLMTDRDIFNFKEFLSDQRYFILSFCGFFAAIYYVKINPDYQRHLISTLILIGIASGLRTVGFIGIDMATNSIKLSFAGQAYLLSAVFYAFLFTYARHYGVLKTTILSFVIFAGAFNISRLDILLIFMDGVILIFLLLYSNLPLKHKLKGFTASNIILILMITIPPIILYNINSSIYYFLVFKMEFFTKELWSGDFTASPAIRIYEFKNIVTDLANSIYPLFIGRGFGAYFIDWHFPFQIPLGLFDYSKEELIIGRYFKPHTFFNFLFLKGGLLMVWLYVYMIWLQVKLAKNILWEKNKDIVFFASFTIFFFPWAFNIFWRPPFIFLFSFIMIILIKISSDIEDKKNLENSA